MKFGVGSTNPVKIVAAQLAIEKVFLIRGVSKDFELQGFEVPSGVSVQPMSDKETKTGAQNRAQAILDQHPEVDTAFGLEGGVMDTEEGMYSTVWACVVDREHEPVFANGARIRVPAEVEAGIRAGKEMGDVMNKLMNRENMKHAEGMIGIVTGGVITRTDEYGHLATLAFALYWNQYQ